MTEPEIRTFPASDGYPIHVASWSAGPRPRGRVVVLHGVQSHGGWYHNLGRILSQAGFETHFPDRRGSGANTRDRGHTPSASRLVLDATEFLGALRNRDPESPIALIGISWGAKVAVLAAAETPDRLDSVALICPGLQPRVGVPLGERLQIAWAYFTNRRKLFPVPLADPALFTASPSGQAFIASDPLALRQATAGLLAASTFIDRRVARAIQHVRHPCLLMIGGQDRIIDNVRTRRVFERFGSTKKQVIEYPDGHHTLEFDPDPGLYARDLVTWLDDRGSVHEQGFRNSGEPSTGEIPLKRGRPET